MVSLENALCKPFASKRWLPVILLFCIALLPANAQRLLWLGTLGGGESAAEAVSKDCSVVVGWSMNAAGQVRAFRWTASSGMCDLGTLAGGEWSVAYDVSADGSTIVGVSGVPDPGPLGAETYRGFAWVHGTMLDLGAPVDFDPYGGYPELCYGWSGAYAVSSGGSIIVGYEQEPHRLIVEGLWYAVRWSNGRRERIEAHAVATDVSEAGTVIVGCLSGWPHVWGNGFNRALSNMDPNGNIIYEWPPFGEVNTPYAVSADGLIAVGKGYRNSQYARAIRWFVESGRCHDLGTLGGNQSCALDVSKNGAMVVGWAEDSRGAIRAFRWKSGTMVDLNLLCEHILSPGSYLKIATGMSSDGRYIVGQGYNAETGRHEAFLLDTLDTKQDYAPSPPTNLRAFATSSTKIQLVWKDNSIGEQGYEVERMGESGYYSVIARVGANVTTYTDTGLSPQTTYTYRVRAYNSAGKSPYSNPASATTCSGDLPLWTLNMYRANLHSHSSYSDGKWSLVDEFFPPGGAFTWALNSWVFAWELDVKVIRNEKWDVWAVTDHGEQISQEEWRDTDSAAWYIMNNSPTFTALRGFEWTAFNNVGDPGHMNVLGSEVRKGAYSLPDIPDAHVIANLNDFYAWLAAPGTKAIDQGTVVAQFNHPTTYDDSSHFKNMSLPFSLSPSSTQQLLRVVALMELGSHVAPWEDPNIYEGGGDNLLTGNVDTDRRKSNEYWFRMALSQGWHVAPTNNRDNHVYFGLPVPHQTFTGVWAPSFGDGEYNAAQRTSMILDALRARRVFASEDWNTRLALQARLKRGNTFQQGWYWMGSTIEMPADADALEIVVWVEKTNATVWDYIEGVELFISPLLTSESDNPPWWYVYRSYSTVYSTFTLPKEVLQRQRRNSLGEVYLYIRARTSKGRFLYSAPIWIRGVPSFAPTPPGKEPL